MIGTFQHKGLDDLYRTGATRRIGANYVRKCLRILQMLDVATRPEEMNLVGFHFHSLQGNTQQRWSVRVNANYRITFGWSNDQAVDIDFEDYH